MPITTYKEDLLPEIQYETELEQQSMESMEMEAHEPELAAAIHLSGCVSLIGPIQVCYDVNTSTPSAVISLKVAGTTVFSGQINPSKPCVSFKGSVGVAKFDLAVCLKVAEKRITLSGKACVVFAGCKSFNITLIKW